MMKQISTFLRRKQKLAREKSRTSDGEWGRRQESWLKEEVESGVMKNRGDRLIFSYSYLSRVHLNKW